MRTVTLVALLSVVSTAAVAQKREPIIPAGSQPSTTLTPAIRVGNLVFASGQLGLGADSTIQGQTRTALENTKKVFEAAGTTLSQAVKCTVFLTEFKDFAGMNQVYREFFPTSPPARSTVIVAALVAAGAKIEIECIAAMPQ